MKAVNNYIIINKIKLKPKKVNGLELTESQNTDVRYLKGEIINVGDSVVGINTGDIVWYDKHAGHGIEFNDSYYYVIKHSDVVIIE